MSRFLMPGLFTQKGTVETGLWILANRETGDKKTGQEARMVW